MNMVVYDEDLLKDMISKIGKMIKEERLKRNLSQSDLSRIANIARSQVYKIENGEVRIGLMSLIKIMIALDIPIETVIPKESENVSYMRHLKWKDTLK